MRAAGGTELGAARARGEAAGSGHLRQGGVREGCGAWPAGSCSPDRRARLPPSGPAR